MSIQSVSTEELSESPNDAAARRLRGRMAELRITDVEIASAIHMSQQSFNRRKNGSTPLSVSDLIDIDRATGGRISAVYLLTGETPPPSGDGVVTPIAVRPPGLEPGTHWLTPGTEEGAEILPFEPQDVPLAPAQECGRVIPLAAYREAPSEAQQDAPAAAVVELFGRRR